MRNFIQRNPLATAVSALATLTGLLVSAPSQAVSISQDGLGQVLLYPYYTVEGGYDTGVSVLNSTDQPKAVSVRFRDAQNGRGNIVFKLYLAPHDMWTAAITTTGGGGKLITADKSCTWPKIPASGVEFGEFGGLASEGSFEVIELGVVTSAAVAAQVTPGASCDLQGIDMAASAGATALAPPSGGLTGSATLINVSGGAEYSYEPVVLDGFSTANLWSAEGPDLRAATPKVSQVLDKGRAITSTWSKGEDAVSALLMRASLRNDFVLEPTTNSGTDWVVGMPTKHYYVNTDNPAAPSFSAPFGKASFTADICEYYDPESALQWNREGNSYIPIHFGARQPWESALCGETSVLTFENSNVLGSTQSVNQDAYYDWQGNGFVNGWMEIAFDQDAQRLVSLEGHVYQGLPVTGFMVHDFVNGNVGGLLSNYGGNFEHKYTTVIETP
ncbi:MAG: hypothetical protein ABWY06_23070 [Pseudomonas sp.]|uniref:hypothetical protein n=1 Tax=Pseudomonas sp. TaxID=306 RepID=UPI0033940A1F